MNRDDRDSSDSDPEVSLVAAVSHDAPNEAVTVTDDDWLGRVAASSSLHVWLWFRTTVEIEYLFWQSDGIETNKYVHHPLLQF